MKKQKHRTVVVNVGKHNLQLSELESIRNEIKKAKLEVCKPKIHNEKLHHKGQHSVALYS